MINGKRILAVILARSGSKGLPGKNHRSLKGKPLFLWSVMAAMESKYVDCVTTTSCSVPIQDEWEKYYNKSKSKEKLLYVKRPKYLNKPLVKNEAVVQHAYKFAKKYNLTKCDDFDYIIMLQPTSPLRYDNLLDKCIEKIEKEQKDSLLTVFKTHPFFWYNQNNVSVCPNNYYIERPMRQSIKEEDFAFIDMGSVYISSRDILLNENNRLGGKVCLYETDQFQSLQIDDLKDFLLIEQVTNVLGKVI